MSSFIQLPQSPGKKAEGRDVTYLLMSLSILFFLGYGKGEDRLHQTGLFCSSYYFIFLSHTSLPHWLVLLLAFSQLYTLLLPSSPDASNCFHYPPLEVFWFSWSYFDMRGSALSAASKGRTYCQFTALSYFWYYSWSLLHTVWHLVCFNYPLHTKLVSLPHCPEWCLAVFPKKWQLMQNQSMCARSLNWSFQGTLLWSMLKFIYHCVVQLPSTVRSFWTLSQFSLPLTNLKSFLIKQLWEILYSVWITNTHKTLQNVTWVQS